MSNRKFRSATTYLFGIPNIAASSDRSSPVFADKTRTISLTGNQLRTFGISKLIDLATVVIQPPLRVGRLYWAYEVSDSGSLTYYGEFTVLGAYYAVQPGRALPMQRYDGLPLREQPVGLTTLGDAIENEAAHTVTRNYDEYKSKFEAAEDRIATLQDSIEQLREDRTAEVDRISNSLNAASSEQRATVQTQLDQANAQVDKLYKTLEQKDREIFRLQQNIVELQGRQQQLKMKHEWQRDFDRAQKQLERANQKDQGGMGDLMSLLTMVGNFAPLLLGEKSPNKNGAQSTLSDTMPKPREVSPSSMNGEAPEVNGAIRQPIADRGGSSTPPPPMSMPLPRRNVLPEIQDAESIENTPATENGYPRGESYGE